MSQDHAARIVGLLGDVVLIPNHRLTKKPIGTEWQKRTLEDMKDPKYLAKLQNKNLGVLLGAPSGNLCTIDIDSDEWVEWMLEHNPKLHATTRTKRVRGCNFWIYVDGVYPFSTGVKAVTRTGAEPVGEWRAEGNQTLISGSVIDRLKGETEPTEYKFLREVRPVRMRFEELMFPDGNPFSAKKDDEYPPIRLNPEYCVSELLHPCISASLHNTPEQVLAAIKARNASTRMLEASHPGLCKFYTESIEHRFPCLPNTRNDFITQSVPFLYRALSEPNVLRLLKHFYECHRQLFRDSIEQHMKEASAMLDGVIRTYLESLPAVERQIYEALPEVHRDAFRICRDLAQLPDPPRELQTFFLAFGHLADRTGIHPIQAQRVMRRLEADGVIKQLKKGTRRAKGVRGEAGTYRWLLHSAPLPPAQ